MIEPRPGLSEILPGLDESTVLQTDIYLVCSEPSVLHQQTASYNHSGPKYYYGYCTDKNKP